MPKHVAIGMTMRHMTGSSNILGILNGLGHSSSHSTVLEHDTALATKQLERKTIVPEGFAKRVHTTVVWDNNDFREETPTGGGTTHNINGLLCQMSSPVTGQPAALRCRRSRKQAIDALPNVIEIYHKKRQVGPSHATGDTSVLDTIPKQLQEAKTLDSAYCLSKIPDADGRILPSWTGYNTQLYSECHDLPPITNLGYLPVIDASPTCMDTVYTILKQSINIADELELGSIALVMDQAIYAKAQQIRWENDSFKDRLVVRLGDFHTAMAYMAIIGKRFQNSGLEDILIEAEVVAQGSVSGVLSGHHYNRSVRVHKFMFEALSRMRLKSFIDSCSNDEKFNVLQVAQDLSTIEPTAKIYDVMGQDDFRIVMDMYYKFVEKERSEKPTFNFWSSYIDMVQDLLCLLRGTREGNWELHLGTLKQVLPWVLHMTG